MEELRIKNEQLPVIEINYEDVKKSLEETMDKYKGIVVTEEGLQDCKATQKRLAGLRLKIDGYRKDKKKVMEAPIKEFENQCKELIKLVEDTEKPIKDGIAIYDQKRKDEKKEIALKIIESAIKSHHLSEKYSSQLTIESKYLNLSCSKKSVEDDVEARAFMLEQQQSQELKSLEEKETSIKLAIENANTRIKSKLDFKDFEYLLEQPLSIIINAINKRAESIYKAENPTEVEAKEEPKQEITAKTVKDEYCVVMKATGSKEEIAALSIFLKSNNYKYEALEGPYKVER